MTNNNEIRTWMSYYSLTPSVKLYEYIPEDIEEEEVLRKIATRHESMLNPLDVVFESLVNILQEKISTEILTESENTMVLTKDVKKRAFVRIISYLRDDRENKLRELHSIWLNEVRTYLIKLYEELGDLQKDEVLYRVSYRFRVSGNSAIKAISVFT